MTWADWAGDWSGALTWSHCAVDGPKSATVAVDATGCAPSPEPDIGVRATSCRALVADANRVQRCATAPADSIVSLVAQLAAASQTASAAELPTIEAQCEDVHARLRELARRVRCPL